MDTRSARLSETTHRIVFHDTPNHASWMNQFERWFSILWRTLLKRGTFTSVADHKVNVLAFIEDVKRTMAKPFRRAYPGKALAA